MCKIGIPVTGGKIPQERTRIVDVMGIMINFVATSRMKKQMSEVFASGWMKKA